MGKMAQKLDLRLARNEVKLLNSVDFFNAFLGQFSDSSTFYERIRKVLVNQREKAPIYSL